MIRHDHAIRKTNGRGTLLEKGELEVEGSDVDVDDEFGVVLDAGVVGRVGSGLGLDVVCPRLLQLARRREQHALVLRVADVERPAVRVTHGKASVHVQLVIVGVDTQAHQVLEGRDPVGQRDGLVLDRVPRLPVATRSIATLNAVPALSPGVGGRTGRVDTGGATALVEAHPVARTLHSSRRTLVDVSTVLPVLGQLVTDRTDALVSALSVVASELADWRLQLTLVDINARGRIGERGLESGRTHAVVAAFRVLADDSLPAIVHPRRAFVRVHARSK